MSENRPGGGARKVAVDSVIVTVLNASGQLASFVLFAGVATLFGATRETDAFFLAMTIPALFIGPVVNAITSVFIPVMVACRARSPERLGELVGSALLWVLGFSLLGALILGLGTPVVLGLLGKTLSAESQRMVITHTLLLLPLVVAQTVVGVQAAAYNSGGRFWLPAGAATLRHLATLGFLIALRGRFGIMSLPVSFSLGALLQLAFLTVAWPTLAIKVRFRRVVDPEFRRSLRLALPLVLGTVAIQATVLVTRFLAAQLPPGSVTVLDYATRISAALMELLASGVFLVTLANWSELVARGDIDQLRARLRQTIQVVLFIILPVVAILLVLRVPTVALIFERGQFDSALTTTTAGVLAFLLLAFLVELVGRLYVRLFLAWQDTAVLGRLAVLRLATTIVVALVLMRLISVQGLALAEAAGASVVLGGLILAARRRLGPTTPGLLRSLVPVILATLPAATAAHFGFHLLRSLPLWLALTGSAAAGLVVYLGVAALLRVPELRLVMRLLAPRLAPGGEAS